MNQKEIGKDHIIYRLKDCQDRIEQAQNSGGSTGEDLYAARSFFESLFELSPDGLMIVDAQGNILRMNIAAEKLFGYARDELVGKNHDILVPERLRQRHDVEMKSFMQQPRVRVMGIGLQLTGQRKDHSEFAADIDLGPLMIDKQTLYPGCSP